MLPARTLSQWLAWEDFPGPHARGAHGDTPLMRAAWLGHDDIVAALLDAGAQPDAVNDEGNTAFWFACLQGSPATILRLAEAGAPLDHANDDDITCLMQAAESGRLETMRLLMALGADTGPCASDGRGALDMALDRGLQMLELACQNRQAPARTAHARGQKQPLGAGGLQRLG